MKNNLFGLMVIIIVILITYFVNRNLKTKQSDEHIQNSSFLHSCQIISFQTSLINVKNLFFLKFNLEELCISTLIGKPLLIPFCCIKQYKFKYKEDISGKFAEVNIVYKENISFTIFHKDGKILESLIKNYSL